MDDYQKYIHQSRYAKWLEEKGRRETWEETIQRYIDFLVHKYPDQKEWLETVAKPAIVNMDVMPSMRALMTAGPAAERDNTVIYNCAFVAVDTPRAFDEAMYVLMGGTGVGFSVETQFVRELPEVAEEFTESDTTIVVPDSRPGWSKSFRELLSLLYSGQIPKYDMSRVRPAGERLKTMGGRASGPQPLIDLFEFAIDLFQKAAGRKLTSRECHDMMCKVADIVVVGGVRRSAMISLSDLGDEQMRHAKDGAFWEHAPQRALANNSAVYDQKPDVGTFMREWAALYDSKSGERGIFNRRAAVKKAEQIGRDPTVFGTNPCVSGDTPILTTSGHIPIEDVVGKLVSIWNGEEWSFVTPFSTGFNDTVIVELSDGSSLRCTPWHKFVLVRDGKEVRVEADDLRPGDKLQKFPMPVVYDGDTPNIDGYSQGFYAGDGNVNLTHSWIYEPKYVCIPRLIGEIDSGSADNRVRWKHGPMLDKSFVPVNANLDWCLEWLAGLLDSDGTITRDANGAGFQVSSVDKQFLLDVRLMLTRMGVRAKVVKGHSAGHKSMPDGNGGMKDYYCREVYRLIINNQDAAHLVSLGLHLNRLEHHGNFPQRDARRFVYVVSVAEAEPCETFCFTEFEANRGTFNGTVTANCGEILLRSGQFCNLTEVVARPKDTLGELKRKVEIATVLGTMQAGFTDFKYLSAKWKRNCEEEALLGVSITGITDNAHLRGDIGNLPYTLGSLLTMVRETNAEWADKIGINHSKAITTVKPSGTVSQLVNSASGIHPRYSAHYLRSVRADNKDTLTEFLKSQGVPHEPAIGKEESTTVFYFPVMSPEGAVFRDDMTALEQLELWLVYRQHWTDHNPSITVYVREDEWMQVGAWVYEHFDEVGGLSFLPYDGGVYPQAPYRELSEEEYAEFVAQFPEIDWDQFKESEDTTVNAKELACTAGACEI